MRQQVAQDRKVGRVGAPEGLCEDELREGKTGEMRG
jgi:hypothetical protein